MKKLEITFITLLTISTGVLGGLLGAAHRKEARLIDELRSNAQCFDRQNSGWKNSYVQLDDGWRKAYLAQEAQWKREIIDHEYGEYNRLTGEWQFRTVEDVLTVASADPGQPPSAKPLHALVGKKKEIQ